jgi:hypothetical protein
MSTSTTKQNKYLNTRELVWNQHVNPITSTEGWISYNIWNVVKDMTQREVNRKEQQRKLREQAKLVDN